MKVAKGRKKHDLGLGVRVDPAGGGWRVSCRG
jgi:hypothetical protein